MSDEAPRELRPASALLLVAIHTIGTLAILAVGQALTGADAETPVSQVLVAGARLAAALIALYVGLVRHAPQEPTAAALRLERPDGRVGFLALGALFGLLIAPVTYQIIDAIVSLVPADSGGTTRFVTEGPGAEWIVAAAAVVLIPLADEALYRGLIQPRVTRVAGVRRGLLLSVLLYTVSQLNPIMLPAAIGMAILAHASRSTWPAVVAVIASQIGLQAVEDLVDGRWWVTAGATLLAALLLAIAWRYRSVDASVAPPRS